MEEKERCRFVFNSGHGGILCSKCSVIIKVGYQYTEEEKEAAYGEGHLPPQYCESCKEDSKGVPEGL